MQALSKTSSHSAPMLRTTLAIVVFLPSVFCNAPDNGDDPPKASDVAAAGKLFKSSCAMCHLPPDPEHPTDRAWLNQVKDTA